MRLTFARELVSSLQFYQAQPDSLGIGEIVITGGTSHLEGLAAALNQMIGVSVRVGDPLGRVVARRKFDQATEAAIGSLAIPIGLAIEDSPTQAIDLIPAEARAADRTRPSLTSVIVPAAVTVPVAVLTFFFLNAMGDVNGRKDQLSAAKSELLGLCPCPSARSSILRSSPSRQPARPQSRRYWLAARLGCGAA